MSTPFTELNYDQCSLLLRWCASHDWGCRAVVRGDVLQVRDEYTLEDGTVKAEWRDIASTGELFDFAGYEPEGIQEALDDLA